MQRFLKMVSSYLRAVGSRSCAASIRFQCERKIIRRLDESERDSPLPVARSAPRIDEGRQSSTFPVESISCSELRAVAHDNSMIPRNFFAELKRRNVYKVAVAYAVVSWLLIQVATQVFPFFEIPNWAVRLVVLLLIL